MNSIMLKVLRPTHDFTKFLEKFLEFFMVLVLFHGTLGVSLKLFYNFYVLWILEEKQDCFGKRNIYLWTCVPIKERDYLRIRSV